MSTAHRTVKQRFGFAASDKTKLDVRIQDSVVTTSLANGSLVFNAAAAGNSVVDLGANGIPVGDLLSFEAVMKTDRIDEDLDIRLGVASDFATGIQSISAPNLSKGGLGSVRFQASRDSSGNAFAEHVMPSEAGKHMDMSDAVGPLQPFIQVRLVGAPDSAVTVELKEFTLEYRAF
jgi:hypothetical protein